MENENLLPKNIRQIGEIQGRQRICLEDYVMTYIRKRESQENENFLGVFLGERKTAKDTEYVFARGILEIPDPKQSEEDASAPVKETSGKEKSADESPDPWKRLKREQEMYFPGCKILGTCVIGRYPSGRLEELFAHFPEAKCCLFHLQDQEERLYWLEGEKYESVRGYMIFYEQNQRMQEYLEEVFGEKCVEKEGTGDKAILRFREKVKNKAEERSRSFLKLASSFFVVGVLLAGVIAVNRVEEMRETQNATGNAASGGLSDADGGETENVDDAGSESLLTVTDGAAAEGTDAGESAASPESVLAGADAFWADRTEEGESVDEEAEESVMVLSDTATSDGSVSDAEENSENTTDKAESGVSASGAEMAETDTTSSDESVSTEASDEGVSTVASGESVSTAASDASASTAAASEGSASDTATSEESVLDTVASDTDGVATETSSRQTQATYVIREGDTLAAICVKYYGSLDFLDTLCEANGIEDANLILPGQKIVLP